MIKLVTIVGARPQIIKAAALSRAIRTHFSSQITEYLVHTGQHYDENMSQVFFDELKIPRPDVNLNIGSASHGVQTARMLEGIEKVLTEQNPDFLVLYGDTNSTLAGAMAGSKMRIPVVHIEAGLRSFNKSMPEEINRIMCDHASAYLFVPTTAGIRNLENEGFAVGNFPPFSADNQLVVHCGDIMFDNLVHYSAIAETQTEIIQKLKLQSGKFVLCTIHRDNNTDVAGRMQQIFEGMLELMQKTGLQVVIPLHPRTSKLLETQLSPQLYGQLIMSEKIRLIPPISYLEMIALEKNCALVITDSGGVQKEAYFFQKPLIVARPETEWVEIIDNGAGIVTDASKERILDAAGNLLAHGKLTFPPVFGDGHAAELICKTLLEQNNL